MKHAEDAANKVSLNNSRLQGVFEFPWVNGMVLTLKKMGSGESGKR